MKEVICIAPELELGADRGKDYITGFSGCKWRQPGTITFIFFPLMKTNIAIISAILNGIRGRG